MLEHSSEYNDFLKHYIQKHPSCGSGPTSYLSSTCVELVQLVGKPVLDKIILRLRKSKYHSISLDSTPGKSHVDISFLEKHDTR